MPERERPTSAAHPETFAQSAETLCRTGHWWTGPDGALHLSPGAIALLGDGEAPDSAVVADLFRSRDRDAVHNVLSGATPAADGTLRSGNRKTVLRFIRAVGTEAAPWGGILDVSARVKLQHELDNTRKRYAQFESMSQEWLWETDSDLRFTYMSETVEKILGVPVAFHIGKTRRELAGDKSQSLEMEMHLAWVDQHKPFHDFRYWRGGPDSKDQYISITGEPVFDDDGTFKGYRGTGRDMTGQQQIREALLQVNRQLNAANKAKSDALGSLKEANALLEERNLEMERVQEEIRHSALHDALTGLANRRYLDAKLQEAVERCKKSKLPMGLLHVDLDRFKAINDTMGHAAGDTILIHVADVLRETIGPSDFSARVGGDEFVVMTVDKTEEQMMQLAEMIIERLSQPVDYNGRTCRYGASVGIAIAHGGGIDSRSLLSQADMALYRAKGRGRGCAEVFSDDVRREMVHRMQIADGIQAGLDRNEFVPWYQPQIDASDFSICGFEALARWMPPEGPPLSPAVFLDVAAELNKVQVIDRMILERGLADLRRWDDAGIDVPRLSVNVSARRLVDPELIQNLRALDIPHGRLAFELLESVFLDDLDGAMSWNIDTIKDMGIAVELDDFGSGHASIVSMVKLGPDAIKIDQRMTAGITTDPAHRDLAKAIIGIGETLGVRVVAEGVETLEQAIMLSDLGCDVLQGFLFAKPMPGIEVPGFVSNWRDPRQADIAQAI